MDESAADGTDLTLIEWLLSLSVTDRLRFLEDMADGLLSLRDSSDRDSRDNGGPPQR